MNTQATPTIQGIEQSWRQIIDCSNQMEQCAQQQQWNEVLDLAIQRHQQVTQHFDHFPVGPETAEFYYPQLESFLQREEALQTLAKDARKEVMRNGAQARLGVKANNAYRGL